MEYQCILPKKVIRLDQSCLVLLYGNHVKNFQYSWFTYLMFLLNACSLGKKMIDLPLFDNLC